MNDFNKAQAAKIASFYTNNQENSLEKGGAGMHIDPNEISFKIKNES